jgi:hypothetical protein
MAYIGPLPAETFTSFATQEFSTSATTSYTLDHAVTNENEIALFVNNVRQQPGSGKAYTATGTALTLSAATASTDTMYAVFLGRALQTVNPADASVGTSQLASTSVTAAKLNNDIISGTTALAEEPADTDEFLISDAGTLKRIDYSHIKGGGGLILLSSTNVTSGTASVDFTSGIDSTYDSYKIHATDIRLASDDVELRVQYGNGSDGFFTNNYNRASIGREADGDTTTGSGVDGGNYGVYLNHSGVGNASDESYGFELTLVKPSTTDTHKLVYGTLGGVNDDNYFTCILFGGMHHSSTAAVDRIRVIASSGNIDRGRFTLFGVANS